jgi:hypothetical protein
LHGDAGQCVELAELWQTLSLLKQDHARLGLSSPKYAESQVPSGVIT